jgi:hypothetical protein
MDTTLKEWKVSQEHLKEETRAGQELLKEEMLAKLDAHHERMMARMDSQLEKMEACLEKTEAMDLEANPEERESEAVHDEVPKEEAAVETFGALKEQYRDQHLVVRSRGHPNKQTQGNGGSQKKLATASRGMTCRAIPTLHKGHDHQGLGKNNVVEGTRKGWTFRKRHRAQPECNNGVRNQDQE